MLHETLSVVSDSLAAVMPAVDLPDPGPAAPPGMATGFGTFFSWAKWFGLALGVLALIVAAVNLYQTSRRGEAQEEMTTFMKILIAIIIIMFAVSIISAIADA